VHQEEKETLQKKITAMERQFLTGGDTIEESQEFHAAVADAEAKLRTEWVFSQTCMPACMYACILPMGG